MRRPLLLGVLVLVLGALSQSAPAHAGSATVRVGDRLDPATLRIPPGTAVTWENVDGDRHRVRSTSGPTEFDGDMDPGESFTYTFEVAGTWEYRDKRNEDDPEYFGTVIVEPAAPRPAPAARPEAAPPASAGSVTIAGKAFSPASLTVARGGTVTWSNRDDDAHTVTASGAFDSGTLRTGASFSHTFPEAGTFRYVCEFHSEMRGTVTVVAPGEQAAPPAPGEPTSPSSAPPPTKATSPPPTGTVAGGATITQAAPPPPVDVRDFEFAPATLTVSAGTQVTWRWSGQAPHSVTGHGFVSGILPRGAEFRHTFPAAGSFSYACEVHPQMRGTVRVTADPGPAPAAAPPPDGATPGEPDTTTMTTTTTTRKGSGRPAAGQETTAAGNTRSRSPGPGALVLAAAGGVIAGAGAPPLYRHWRRRSHGGA